MTHTEIIFVSSSPLRSILAVTPPRDQTIAIPSSPVLPFLLPQWTIAQEKETYRSTVAAVPSIEHQDSATSPFFVHLPWGLDEPNQLPRQSSPRIGAAKQPLKQTATVVEKTSTSTERSTVRAKPTKLPKSKRKSAGVDEPSIEPPVPLGNITYNEKDFIRGASPQQKISAKKRKDEKQTSLKTGKITKPGGGKGNQDLLKAKKATKKRKSEEYVIEEASDPFEASEYQGVLAPQPKMAEYEMPLMRGEGTNSSKFKKQPTREALAETEYMHIIDVERAIPRRREWTPVVDHNGIDGELTACSVNLNPDNCAERLKCAEPSKGEFRALISNYERAETSQDTPKDNGPRSPGATGPTKRRKIELNHSLHHSGSSSKAADRSKATKKQPQTITRKVTAQYIPTESAKPSPLLQYFSQTPLDSDATNLPQKTSLQQPKPKKRKISGVTKTAKTKTPKPLPILLSPMEAMDSIKDQELLFGTSSQLAGEESPTFITAIQKTLKASEEFHDIDHFDSAPFTNPQSPNKPGSFSKISTSRDLWSIAARDLDGSLLDAEVIDMRDTPRPTPLLKLNQTTIDNTPTRSRAPALKPQNPPSAAPTTTTTTTPSNPAPPNPPKPSTTTTPNLPNPPISLPISISISIPPSLPPSLPLSVAEAALRQRPKTHFLPSPTKKPKKTPTAKPAKPTKTAKPAAADGVVPAAPMPDFKGYSITQLNREIAKYGFKTIKNRDTMVELVQRCWEGKNRLALQVLAANAAAGNSLLGEKGDGGGGGAGEMKTKIKAGTGIGTGRGKRRGRPPKEKAGGAAGVVVEGAGVGAGTGTVM